MPTSSLLPKFKRLQECVNQTVIGQERVVEQLVIALLAKGHVLIQGLPGLAKTRAVNGLANNMNADLHRIQFTPDMLPGDVTGGEVYDAHSQSLSFKRGPVFSNLLLADEINRAPAKVQSALLEAMAENQVSVGGVTYPLPELFMVLATQNPVEQEGTYPLPEAQMDRFLMQVLVEYPEKNAEKEMLKMLRSERLGTNLEVAGLSVEEVQAAQNLVEKVSVSDAIDQYIVDIIDATRYPEKYSPELASFIQLGASPRAAIALDKCARSYAWLNGRDYVTPDDIRAIVHTVLRHRIALSFTALSDKMTTDRVIDLLLEQVAWV
ncbi:MoxR family ATPase [Vibrio kyushuensis]|uniref:AAA family ATPase n=1 Tax=Vibrio kyushuensis TaxID=2910249 RepID=UPI003D0F0EA9